MAADLSKTPLAERLGFTQTDKVLIVNGDDVGMSHAANLATIDCMENGFMTTGTIMMPCPWVSEIAEYARTHPKADFGIHLTHTSEWGKYRWGPVAGREAVPGLVDPQGYLWPDILSVYQHSKPDEAEQEGRAQIEMALRMGIDVTHLDSHMGTLQYSLTFYKVYHKLAKDYDLPLRMASQEMLENMGGGQLRAELERDGILSPDYLIHGGKKKEESTKEYWLRMLGELRPGVTELYIHAALLTDEMRAITGSAETRAAEHKLFTSDPEIKALLEKQNAKFIGYRALRDLQRKERRDRK